MSKLLQRYINKDVGQRYDNDFVSYFLEYAAYDSDHYLRDIIHTVPTQVINNYHEIASAFSDETVEEKEIGNGMTYRRKVSPLRFCSARFSDIQGAMIECASKNSRTKKFVDRNFPHRSIPQHHLTRGYEKRILNSPSLCVYIDVDYSILGFYTGSVYTKDTDTQCYDHALNCIVNKYNSRVGDFIVKMTSNKPSTISLLTKSRLEKMDSEKLIFRLLSSWRAPRIKKTILEKNIFLESEAAKYLGEMMTMHKMSGTEIPASSSYILRMLTP